MKKFQMHIKIIGGGNSTYANTGSCGALVNYLQHEDYKMIFDNQPINHFFSLTSDNVPPDEVQISIDQNKAKLCKDDSKFFSVVVSPSPAEIKNLGDNENERIENLKSFVQQEVMQSYAENFNKNLNNEDIMFYGKIHKERGSESNEDLHAHIIISRKTIDNKIKISPQTNHKNTQNGKVKGGFNRKEFMNKCEVSFDKRFQYQRKFEDSFEYKNALKNGSFESKQKAFQKAAEIKYNEDTKKQNRPREINQKIVITTQKIKR